MTLKHKPSVGWVKPTNKYKGEKMKKLFVILASMFLFACTTQVSVADIFDKLPNSTTERKSVVFRVPSTNSFSTDMIYVGMLKTIGSEQSERLIKVLSIDNINLGIVGNNSIVNKSLVLDALKNAPTIGKNLEIYMMGAASDQQELENAAKMRNVKLHYFIKE